MAVELSNGNIIRSDSNDAARDEVEEQIRNLLSDWSKVSNFHVTKSGHDIFVNPAHICAIWIEEA